MTRVALLLLLALLLASPFALGASARGGVVGVSWSHFQEERWKTDEAAMRAVLEQRGARYLAADAQSSSEKQISDIETLIARGAEVLIVLAQDADAIGPAIALAQAEGIPVIGYDRLIEIPGVFYLSFDNVEVGRIQAREIERVQPSGRYVFIKGGPTDPNADFVHSGQLEILKPAIDAGRIEIVGDQYVDGWLPELAQRITEQILTANADRVDAIVCSNDGMAGGVAAALRSQGLGGMPLSGQDGDHAALNRVARGLQTVSVWKDARALGRRAAEIALDMAAGTSPKDVPGATPWSHGPRGTAVDAILLEPIAITRKNLGVVVDADWIPRETLCRSVTANPPDACR